jgi:hypothetical protein
MMVVVIQCGDMIGSFQPMQRHVQEPTRARCAGYFAQQHGSGEIESTKIYCFRSAIRPVAQVRMKRSRSVAGI